MVETQNPELSIKEQCTLLGMARSSYYYEAAEESEENLAIMRRIDELYTDNPTWGSRKMRDKLRGEGFKVNRKRIQRLSRKMGIQTIFPKRNLSKRNHEHSIFPYLLRGVQILEPNHVWSTDITYIRLSHGWVYLVAIIDWYSKAILAWKLSNTMDRFFCMDVLREAIERFGTPAIFNTDQGAQFTNPDFIGILKAAGIKISMNGKGRALDNLPIERFWRTLKWDEVYLKDYENMADAKENIGRYIEKYNSVRPHASLGGRTPMNVYTSRCDGKVVA
jgi:putative transposase